MAIVTTLEGHTTADFTHLLRLQSAYADAATRRSWDEVAALFRPDAHITVDTRTGSPHEFDGPGALCEFIAKAIGRFSHFQIALTNQVVDLDPARGRVYTLEVRREAGEWTDAHGVYHDLYERSGDPGCYGGWQFARRHYHSLARTGPNSESFPFPDIDPVTLRVRK